MKWFKNLVLILSLLLVIYFSLCASLIGVNPETNTFLDELKISLKQQGYCPSLIVMSSVRFKWQNELIRPFGAAKNSQHLKGNAIDVLVLDINQDGSIDARDVDIVYAVLNNNIVRNKGGLGSYKGTWGFFSRQMIHFDCRGVRARWNR